MWTRCGNCQVIEVNVLFLTQVLPYPLDAGPKVRAYYVLRYLVERHTVTLASFTRPSDSATALSHLQAVCARVVGVPMVRARWRDGLGVARAAARGEPVLIARDWRPEMQRALAELMAETKYDVIHADQLWMAPYALAAAQAAHGQKPWLVLDQHNAVYLVLQRMAEAARSPMARLAWRRETRLMARYEAGTCRAFDRVVTVTGPDLQALQSLYPAGWPPTLENIIPICVDLAEAPQDARPARPPGILFLGGMHWPPNSDGILWFYREVLPAVLAACPETTVHVVGRQPPAVLSAQPHAAAIQVPGYVEDAEPYWEQARVFVVPLRAGGGMRVKILNAWAHGVPVVSTTIGAEGLDYADGENLLLADTPEAFAQAVSRVLTDEGLAQRLAAGGRHTVEARYDWRTVYTAWDRVYAARQA
jgi:glycosyltransferase involved in cell wall biosynthesis